MSRISRSIACLCVATAAAIGFPVATPAGAAVLATRPLRTYVPVGTAVAGTSSPAGAPSLAPGQYTDSLRVDEQKNYTVTLADGVTPYFSVTLIRPIGVVPESGQDYASFSDEVKIAISTSGGVSCGSDYASTSQGRSVRPAISTARPGRVGNGWSGDFSSTDTTCGKPGKYVIAISRSQSSELIAKTSLPIEIVFVAEPPLADDVTTLPGQRPVSTASLAPDITATAKAVTGGGSYSTAAVLPKSGGYTDSIRPGETLFYRIRLGQGQRLGYTVRFHGVKAIDEPLRVSTSLNTPYRGTVMDSDQSGSYSRSSDETLTGQMAAPVAYRNRESDISSVENLRLDGYYYLVVNLANSSQPTTADIPFNIAVEVDGKAQDPPKYRHVAGASNPDDLGLPGQDTPGLSLRKVAFFTGGGLALALALLVLLVPLVRRRST